MTTHSAPAVATDGPPAPNALISSELPPPPAAPRAAITAGWVRDEASHVRALLDRARLPEADRVAAQATAADLVRRVRARAKDQGAIEEIGRAHV